MNKNIFYFNNEKLKTQYTVIPTKLYQSSHKSHAISINPLEPCAHKSTQSANISILK